MVKKFTYINLLLYTILWLVFLVSFVSGLMKGGWFVYHYASLVCFVLAPFFIAYSLLFVGHFVRYATLTAST